MSVWLSPEQLRRTRPAVKNAIFSGNASKIYGIDTGEEARAALDADGLALAKREYEETGTACSNLAYGYVRAAV